MKVLALGATGAIGLQLVSLLAKNERMDVHVSTRQARESTGGVTFRQGNALDGAFLDHLLEEPWDVIIDFMVYETKVFAQRVEQLVGGSRQYIYISSSRVFSESDAPITESSPRLLETTKDTALLASDEYAIAKARQEDILRAHSNSNWTIVRPYITFGEGRLQLGNLEKEDWLFRALHGRPIVFCSDLLEKKTTLTDGSVVAAMMHALIGAPAALEQDYNLVGPHTTTWGEVLDLYLKEMDQHLGWRPCVILQDLNQYTKAFQSVAQVKYDRMFDRIFDTSKIDQCYEIKNVQRSMEALRTRMRSQLESGVFLPIDARAEALRDKVAHVYSWIGAFESNKNKLRYAAHRILPQNTLQSLRKL